MPTTPSEEEKLPVADLAALRKARAPLADINVSFLQLLVDMARVPGRPAGDFIAPLQRTLCHLPEPVTAIAARTPVLLIDMQFGNEAWWQAAASHPARAPRAARWLTVLPKGPALRLARATLTLAWHLTRTDLAAGTIFMGLTAPVSGIVAALRVDQLDAIAERQYRHLRPRWEDRPALWLQLLCRPRHELDARAFTLRALQLSWSSTPASV